MFIHSVLPKDRALSQQNNLTWKTVLKSMFIGELGKNPAVHIHCSGFPTDRAFVQFYLEDKSWKGCSLLTLWKSLHIHWPGPHTALIQLIQYFNEKMILKRLFVSDIEEASAHSFRSPRRQNTLSWNDIVTLKLILKRPLDGNTGEASACSLLGLQGDRAHQIYMTGLLRSWSCKGHLSLTQGCLCSSFRSLGRQMSPSQHERLLRRWSCKGNTGNLCMFLQVFWDTECIELIW